MELEDGLCGRIHRHRQSFSLVSRVKKSTDVEIFAGPWISVKNWGWTGEKGDKCYNRVKNTTNVDIFTQVNHQVVKKSTGDETFSRFWTKNSLNRMDGWNSRQMLTFSPNSSSAGKNADASGHFHPHGTFSVISIQFQSQLNIDSISIQFRLNFSTISVRFRLNFDRISAQFQFKFDLIDFDSISTRFHLNFESISVQFRLTFDSI